LINDEEELAYEIAIAHLCGNMIVSKDVRQKEVKVKNTTYFYDLEGNISAYSFEFVDKMNKDSGYIIVGANDDYPTIVEYATDGAPFYHEAVKSLKSDKSDVKEIVLYYTGDLDYFIGTDNTNKIFSIQTSAVEAVSADKVKKNSKKVKDKYKSQRDGWKNVIANGEGSTPPVGDYITDPYDHENGYDSVNLSNVPSYYITYSTTSDFSGYSNHCGPTAGTNVMRYWYNRDDSTYSGLYLNNSWDDVFVQLYTDMKVATNDTTYSNDFEQAIKDFFDDNASGYSSIDYYSSNVSWSKIETEIDADYPPVLLLQKHELYGDHYVLGLGYKEFFYDGFLWNNDYSRYIRIADGWTSSPNRYVHFDVGYESGGGIGMCKIRP
jgi:hypothetical protein